MGVLEEKSKEEQKKQEIFDKLPEYELLGMTEEDVDLEIAEE
ncbi:MAG: hypothetical protein Q4C25_08900 [Bacillota bacterium]|nr:hypothetical protein [Bacillota bacterium]